MLPADAVAQSSTAAAWSEITPPGGPSGPILAHLPATIGYDPGSNRLVVFIPSNPAVSGGLTSQVWVLTNANGLGSTPTWTQLSPSGTSPAIEFAPAGTYDAASNRLIIYGGCIVHCGSVSPDVWVLTNANGLGGTPAWTQLSPSAAQGRADHTVVYDPTTDRLIAFGGQLGFFGTDQNDTRTLSNATGRTSPATWTTLAPAGALPGIRADHTAVYDAAQARMIVFGGQNNVRTCCPYDIRPYNDTWVLASATGTTGAPSWQQLATSGGSPPARSLHAATYDQANDRLLVFGGRSWSNVAQSWNTLGDLWELSHANGLGSAPVWRQLTPAGTPPPAIGATAAALDTANQRLLVFGGIDQSDAAFARVWVASLPPAGTGGSGNPGGGTGSISGGVYQNTTASPLVNAGVEVCNTVGACTSTQTGPMGQFSVRDLAAGDYKIRAFPPSGATLDSNIIGPITLTAGATLTGQNVILHDLQPLFGGAGSTTITQDGVQVPPGTVPALYRNRPFTMKLTSQCPTATVNYLIRMGNQDIQGAFREIQPDLWEATVTWPFSAGAAHVMLSISTCTGTGPRGEFDVLFTDPSGAVRTTSGAPLAGAMVTLLRAENAEAVFEQVPEGSSLMSPANRHNPSTTDSLGQFGWDVLAGFYKVRAEATGCAAPGAPAQPFVESGVLTIPPPATEIDLRLLCESTPPVTAPTLTPALNAAGWTRTDTVVRLDATDNPGGTGVATTYYAVDSAGCTPAALAQCAVYDAPFAVTAEGIHTISYFSVDKAGNAESLHQLPIRIDKTAPEAVVQFDPTTQDIAVIGKDALSGAPPGPTAPQTVVIRGAGNASIERRTYTVTDLAGNTLVVSLDVRRAGAAWDGQVVGLRYNGGAEQPPPPNDLAFTSVVLADGRVQSLVQRLNVTGQSARAVYTGPRDETLLFVPGGSPRPSQTRTGLVLLGLTTDRGSLTLTVPAPAAAGASEAAPVVPAATPTAQSSSTARLVPTVTATGSAQS
jgi:hypothetical protein